MQTIEEIAMEVFDAVKDDNDEGTFDQNAYLRKQPEDDLTEKQPDEKQPDEKEKQAQPEKLYGGKFKTVEELEAAYNERLTQPISESPKPPEKQPDKEKLADLTSEELILLHEQDEQDGKNYTQEYLTKKMSERDLTDFEIAKLRELDTNEKDLYGEYIAIRTERSVMNKLQPTLEPLQEEQRKKQQYAYIESERQINESNKAEFGEELPELAKKVSDPKFLAEALKGSPNEEVIFALWNSGQKALAHKHCLREVQGYIKAQKAKELQGKKEKSFPADIGGKSGKTASKKASTVDEAFEESLQELNL